MEAPIKGASFLSYVVVASTFYIIRREQRSF